MENISNKKKVEEVEVKEVKELKKADPEELKLQELVPESLEKNKDPLTNSSPLATEEKTSETLSPTLKTGGEKQESSSSAEIGEKRSEDEVLKEGESHEESRQLTTVESRIEVEEKIIPDFLESNIDGKSTEKLSKAGVKSIDVNDSNKSIPSGSKNRLEPTELSSNQFDSTASKFVPIRIREDLLLKKPLNIRIKTEENNTVALQQEKQPPNNATTKNQRRNARRRLKQLAMSASKNSQMNAGNLPENPDTLSSHGNSSRNNLASERNQIIWQNQETSIGDQEMRGCQVISSGNKAIRKRKKNKLPKNQNNMTTNEQNLSPVQREPFINQENRSWYPQLSPLNPENFVALPSTSRGEISQIFSGNVSGKRKRKFKDSSLGNPQNVKRPRYSERVSPSKNHELAKVIITDDYWKVGITKIELGLVRKSISQEIDRIQEGPIPRFNKAYIQSGGIVVESADLWSRDWLTNMVPRLNPLNGTFLKVVGLESLDKFYRATMWIPGMMENPESILQRLEKQNSTLKTEVWRIYAISEEFTPNGYYVILGIPHSSVQALQEVDFKLYLGLSRITICVNGWT